jgi:hypothetical protein
LQLALPLPLPLNLFQTKAPPCGVVSPKAWVTIRDSTFSLGFLV